MVQGRLFSNSMSMAGSTFSFEHRGRSIDLGSGLARLERHLTALGVGPGMTIATIGGNRQLDILLLLLLPRLGCRFLPLDPALPPVLRERLLGLAEAGLVLDETFGFAAPGKCSGGVDANPPPAEGIRLLVATSGTTGDPQLIELTGRNLLAGARAANALLGLAPGDCWLGCLPTHHVAGLAIPLRCLLAGAALKLLDRFDPGEVLDHLASGAITHLSLVPTMLRRLLEAGSAFRPPATLRVVLLGGAPASRALVQQALDRGWPVCPTYGLTEASSQVATLYPPLPGWEEGLVGYPLPHMKVGIDEQQRIRLRSESIARYRITPRGSDSLLDEDGWLTTRDLGRLDSQGRLWVLGREDDLVISGGEKIQPSLVESLLLDHPGVTEAAVIGLEDERWGQRLVACYCGEALETELEPWASGQLSGAFRPRRFIRLERLPRNPLGKLLRAELQRLASQRLHAEADR